MSAIETACDPANAETANADSAPAPDMLGKLSGEQMIPLSSVAEHLPIQVKYQTVSRWTKLGAKGVKLESVRVGARVFTSVEAIKRFLAATQ